MKNLLYAVVLTLALRSQAQICTVDWNDVHQRIDGFGASCAMSGRTWLASTADTFFSTNSGLGLSLLRNQIQAGGYVSASELGLMKLAQARGARLWSTPWTPQNSFKSNNNPVQGNFLSASNQAYASQLANYVKTNANAGVSIYAISIQNEPDANVSYVSCHWTPQQIHDFTTNLYTALVASNVASTKIILPESQNWSDPQGLGSTALNDPNAAADVGIIANHNYVGDNLTGDTNPPAVVPGYGKALWETEVATLGGTFDSGITNAMYWANRIHLFLTGPEVNAWHYWWLITGNSDNEGLEGTGDVATKRMYVVGQFSRFIRPNFYRIGTTNVGVALISAYKDTNSAAFAVVAINTNTAPINQTFNLVNFTVAGSVTPWITSSNLSLASQPPVAVSGASFTYSLPALSVVTFVGQATITVPNTAPTLTPVADQVIDAGTTLAITNIASDPNQPLQALTFSLLGTPDNVMFTQLDNTNAVLIWRPLVSQADTTNSITVKVADSGVPVLSATNSFTITVNPLTRPTVSSINVANGRVSLVVTGAMGPDYTLLTSTNLNDWQPSLTTNSPLTPVTLTVPDTGDPVRFYRIQLGP